MNTPATYPLVISTEELLALQAAQRPLMVFDCSFDLADVDAGEAQYRALHIAGAVYAHLDRDLCAPHGAPGPNGEMVVAHGIDAPVTGGRHPLPTRERFARWLSAVGFSNGMQAVVYDRNGNNFCARLWWLLKWCGHDAVAILDGGLAAWQAAGGATRGTAPEAGDHESEPSHFQNNFDLGEPLVRLARTDEVQAGLGGVQTLIDARAGARYRGEVEPMDPVAGRIPGALNRPFGDNLGADGRFKPPAQLRQEFDTLLAGRDPGATVAYCGSGVSATPNVLAMALAGLPVPALYAESWSEWCSDATRPVARG